MTDPTSMLLARLHAAGLTDLGADWRDRMPILQLRQHLAVIAQFDDDWGAADQVRATLAPFRRRPGQSRANRARANE
jgi:hypothetical protein